MHVADQKSFSPENGLGECHLIALHSEWIGTSYMRVRTRSVGKKNKIVVDVWEMVTDGHRTSKARARKVAREAALKARADTTDYCVLLDFETDRKASRFTGEQVLVKIRQTSFAF